MFHKSQTLRFSYAVNTGDSPMHLYLRCILISSTLKVIGIAIPAAQTFHTALPFKLMLLLCLHQRKHKIYLRTEVGVISNKARNWLDENDRKFL